MSQVTQLFTGYVSSMLAEYAAKPGEAWKAKDCAVYLVIALAGWLLMSYVPTPLFLPWFQQAAGAGRSGCAVAVASILASVITWGGDMCRRIVLPLQHHGVSSLCN